MRLSPLAVAPTLSQRAPGDFCECELLDGAPAGLGELLDVAPQVEQGLAECIRIYVGACEQSCDRPLSWHCTGLCRLHT